MEIMAEPLLEARNLTKHYGQVQALDGASFTVYPGEVVALIGDNGAGKSTLVKALSGAIRPDSGQILIEGKPVTLSSPLNAREHGIETVYQDLALAPDLDAAANLHLGREIYLRVPLLHVLNQREMQRQALTAFSDHGIDLPDPSAPVASLSGGQRQSIAVARAVAFASQVVFMDEPTAALGVVQRGRVLETVRRVRDRGVAVVLISHNMPEVLAVADRIEVLRLGRRVARFTAAQATVEDLVGAMTGAIINEEGELELSPVEREELAGADVPAGPPGEGAPDSKAADSKAADSTAADGTASDNGAQEAGHDR
jgi:simple sugar transport system ATP-binding protein